MIYNFNSRPVSFTSICGKVRKLLIRDSILAHLVRNNFHIDVQHGFVLCRFSPYENTLRPARYLHLVATRQGVEVDFVNHRVHQAKSKAHAMFPTLYRWIAVILKEHSLKLRVGDKFQLPVPRPCPFPYSSMISLSLSPCFATCQRMTWSWSTLQMKSTFSWKTSGRLSSGH